MAQGVWLVQQGRRAECLQGGQSRDPCQVPAPRLRDSHAGRGLPACPAHQGSKRPRPPDVGSPKLGTRQAANAAEQEAERQAYRTHTASRAGHQCADLQVANRFSPCWGATDGRGFVKGGPPRKPSRVGERRCGGGPHEARTQTSRSPTCRHSLAGPTCPALENLPQRRPAAARPAAARFRPDPRQLPRTAGRSSAIREEPAPVPMIRRETMLYRTPGNW